MKIRNKEGRQKGKVYKDGSHGWSRQAGFSANIEQDIWTFTLLDFRCLTLGHAARRRYNT